MFSTSLSRINPFFPVCHFSLINCKILSYSGLVVLARLDASLNPPLPACLLLAPNRQILGHSDVLDDAGVVQLGIVVGSLGSGQLAEGLAVLPIKRWPEPSGYFKRLEVQCSKRLKQSIVNRICLLLFLRVPLWLTPVAPEKMVVRFDGAQHLEPELVPQLLQIFHWVVENLVGSEGQIPRASVHIVDLLQGQKHSA